MRVPIPLFAAALALVAIGATAAATEPGSGGGALPVVAGGSTGDVVRASVVCPDLRFAPGAVSTTVAVGVSNPAPGTVTAVAAAGKDRTGTPVLSGGQQRQIYSGSITGPLELRAEGAPAGSLVAEQAARAPVTADRGWSEARCEPPRAEQWFVGAATVPGATPVLELVNPTDTLAVVDVAVYTPDGRSATNLAHNVSLAAHTVAKFNLTDLAPNAAVTAVHVTATTGRVSAALLDTRTSGQTFLGTDWLPVTQLAPSQLITGIPGANVGATPQRFLVLAGAGNADARVQVQVIGPTGTFVPVGLESIAVPAGTVQVVELSKALGTNSGGVIVTSKDPTVPIVANVIVDAPSTKNQPIREIAYLGPNSPLQGPGIIPLVYTAGDLDSLLAVSAPKEDVSVLLSMTNAAGAVIQQRLDIQGGTTFSMSLRAAGAADGSSATLTPFSTTTPVYASRMLQENGALGPLISAYGVVGAPSQQPIPRVVEQPLS